MQPVSTSNIQKHPTTTIQKKPVEQNPESAKAAAKVQKEYAGRLPEDIVNLSTSPTLNQNSSKNKIPSTPVSNPEKEALLKNSSGKIGFSI